MQYCNKTWCINGAAALLGTIALLGLGVFLFITGAMAFDAAGPVGRFSHRAWYAYSLVAWHRHR